MMALERSIDEECLHHFARVGRRDDKELDAGLAATILPCEYLLGICPR